MVCTNNMGYHTSYGDDGQVFYDISDGTCDDVNAYVDIGSDCSDCGGRCCADGTCAAATADTSCLCYGAQNGDAVPTPPPPPPYAPLAFTITGGLSTSGAFQDMVFDVQIHWYQFPMRLNFGATVPLSEQDLVYIVETSSSCDVFPWASGTAAGPYAPFGSLLTEVDSQLGFDAGPTLGYQKLYQACYWQAGASAPVPVTTAGTVIFSGSFDYYGRMPNSTSSTSSNISMPSPPPPPPPPPLS